MNTVSIEICEVVCSKDSNGDLREYINTSIGNGTAIKSLCDPGAQANGISPKILSEHGMSDLVDETQKGQAKMADNHIVETRGVVTIDCEIEGETESVPFAVIENLSPSIIYGTPFLNKTGVLADFRQSIDNKIRNKPKN